MSAHNYSAIFAACLPAATVVLTGPAQFETA